MTPLSFKTLYAINKLALSARLYMPKGQGVLLRILYMKPFIKA